MIADGDAAPSGVVRVRPLHVREAMLRSGWGVLPILAHNASAKGAGKRPLIQKWQEFAHWGAKLASAADLRSWERKAFQAPGTGIPCGDVVGIDLDFSDPVLAKRISQISVEEFGETPFVRQGQEPKVLFVYRAAEEIASRPFKANGGSGDGLDILATGRQFVAFGIHPRTLRHYQWIGPESPLTAGPEIAPAITAAQIDSFVERVRGLVELSKTGGRRRAGLAGGETGEIVRNPAGIVVDGREAWLTRKIHQAANELHANNAELSVQSLSARGWTLFTASAKIDDGRWTEADAEAKARAWLDRYRRGLVTLGQKIERVAPTFTDERRPLAEATTSVGNWVESFFREHVPAYRNARIAYEVGHHLNPLLLPPQPRHWVLRIETGIGKSELAIQYAATAVGSGLDVIYFIPRVELADEVVARFVKHGVAARAYRGRDKLDPDNPGETMCLNVEAIRDARESGAWSVFESTCERRDGATHQILRCPFFDQCGHVRQRSARPSVWVMPHALLFQRRPAFITAPNALVLDENFLDGALPGKPARLTLDEIEGASLPAVDNADDLARLRSKLVNAMRESPDGPIEREMIAAAGLTADSARAARKLEYARRVDPRLYPGMEATERTTLASTAGLVNREVFALAGLWGEIAEFLDGSNFSSGRLRLVLDAKTRARTIERRSLTKMHETWHAPALILDATAPPPKVLEAVLGHPVELKASIAAKWSPHGRVRQIVGAPVSATKLGIKVGEEHGGNKRILLELRRLIAIRAALVYPRRIVVVAQKAAIEKLSGLGLPSNVDVGHFGALAGLDHFKSAAGMIVVGRPLPDPLSIETAAGVLLGVPVETTGSENGRTRWYDRAEGGIRLTDGAAIRVEHPKHPDPTAEALRQLICEGQLIQAIGRLRPLRRGADQPFFLDIVNDVPLPIVVDVVESWNAARPAPWAEMVAGGVILSSRTDVLAAYPDLDLTEDQARAMAQTFPGETSIMNSSIDVSPGNRSARRAAYKGLGRGKKIVEALILPNGPQGEIEFRKWLADHIGPIDRVEVERVRTRIERFARIDLVPRRVALALETRLQYLAVAQPPARKASPIHVAPCSLAPFVSAIERIGWQISMVKRIGRAARRQHSCTFATYHFETGSFRGRHRGG
jgi:hypothetical protein